MSKSDKLFSTSNSVTAGWIRDMHAHFAENGYYRGEDIQRVLGDPRKSISLPQKVDKEKELVAAKLVR